MPGAKKGAALPPYSRYRLPPTNIRRRTRLRAFSEMCHGLLKLCPAGDALDPLLVGVARKACVSPVC
jgi:hypothetical protein